MSSNQSLANELRTFDEDKQAYRTFPVTQLIDKIYDYIGFSNADSNGNYQTMAFKSGGASGNTVRTLTLAYDGSNNVTSILRS